MNIQRFLVVYVIGIVIIALTLVTLILIGSFKVNSNKNKSGLKNIYVTFVYRLIQLYLVFQGLFFLVILSMQLFSFRPYFSNPKNGVSLGLADYADGYPIPVTLHLEIPESIVSTEILMDSTPLHFERKYHFSLAGKLLDQVMARQDESTMPAAFGPDHFPYSRVDTFKNEIRILNTGKKHGFTFTPPQNAAATAHFLSKSGWKNFLFSLFNYFRVIEHMVIAFLLLKILTCFRKGELFAPKSFSFVNGIGLTLMGYQLIYFILTVICNRWLLDPMLIIGHSSLPYYKGNINIGVSLDYNFNMPLFITGFLLVLLAQVFKRGILLEQDQKLTI